MDLFEDESITYVDSIKDAREVDRIRTGFSKEFNLPGSKVNNRYFKHWHNPQALQSFDARYKAAAKITLEGTKKYDGYVRLNRVDERGGRIFAYKVVFFENTVNLGNIFGDDTLADLDLSAYDHDFDVSTVRSGLQGSLSSGAIRYPLLTHTTRYFFTSLFEDINNLALDYKELKPAIQCSTLIAAIETKYSVTLTGSGSYFNDTDFDKLYLWCHRDKGIIVGGDEEQTVEVPFSEWSYNSGDGDLTPIVTSTDGTPPFGSTSYVATFTITPNDSSLYDVEIIDEISGDILNSYPNRSGTDSYIATFTSGVSRTWQPKVRVTTAGGIASFTIDLDLTKNVTGSSALVSDYNSTTTTFNVISYVVITSQIPKMKVTDFLRGLFKAHNLVAEINSDGEYVFRTLDAFYATGTTWDLTEYTNTWDRITDRQNQYSNIVFKYQDPVTFLTKKHNSEFEKSTDDYGFINNFGELNYTDLNGKYDGEEYRIELPFEHMAYEPLFSNAGAQTDLTLGWFVDDKEEPTVGSPLLLYVINTSCSTNNVRWIGASNSTNYNRPANVSSGGSINFGAEIDEHALTLEEDSLFSRFYATYISNIFDRQTRIVTYDAVLPYDFIMNYSLADTIIIREQQYRINEIRINLLNRRGRLELITI